jgi:hypothetical protein
MKCCFTYDFLPVGQGLFSCGELEFLDERRTPRSFRWVYDCGSLASKRLEAEIDLFKGRLSSAAHLDLLILSHFDKDHVCGIGRLLKGLRVAYLVLPYLTPTERMVLAAFSDSGDRDWIRFLLDPARYLATLSGVEIETIVFVRRSKAKAPTERAVTEGGGHPDPDQPIEFPGLSPATPTQVGDDPGMRTKRVKVTDGRNPMTLSALWEFMFFNQPTTQQPRLRRALKPLLEAFRKQREAKRDYDNFVRQLRTAYDRIFGKKPRQRNAISLAVYTGPVVTKGIHASYRPHNCPNYPAAERPSELQAYALAGVQNTSVGLLYTGDLTVDVATINRTRYRFGIDRWRRVHFLQVPHHGSRHAWKPGEVSAPHRWSVFSAGFWHEHPHYEVVFALRNHELVIVNEFEGAQWRGCAGPASDALLAPRKHKAKRVTKHHQAETAKWIKCARGAESAYRQILSGSVPNYKVCALADEMCAKLHRCADAHRCQAPGTPARMVLDAAMTPLARAAVAGVLWCPPDWFGLNPRRLPRALILKAAAWARRIEQRQTNSRWRATLSRIVSNGWSAESPITKEEIEGLRQAISEQTDKLKAEIGRQQAERKSSSGRGNANPAGGDLW